MKYNFCFRFLATCANQQHYKTSPHGVGWCFGGSVCTEQFLWRILDKKNHGFYICKLLGKRDEAWPMYHVWPISKRFMHGWSGGKLRACFHWLNTGMVDGRCPIMFVLTQSYPCATWFVCSTLRELAVGNLGQLLFCLSITWSRYRNAYRDLWIITTKSTICSPFWCSFIRWMKFKQNALHTCDGI